jgi:dienelactone hydrolase
MKEHEVWIGVNRDRVGATLNIPAQPRGLIIFAHGSGSSRFSPRNTFVAQALNNAFFATLLLDLLTREEEQLDNRTRELRFKVEFLAHRLIAATDWAMENYDNLSIGYFGASTGAAAAIVAANQRHEEVRAIVSRGGRPDLAKTALTTTTAPTLLIVGGNDEHVLDLNRKAAAQLPCDHNIVVVPGATHLFKESGALDAVAELATAWFVRYLTLARVR